MLNKYLKKYQLVLASASPRRQQFLKDLGLSAEIRLKSVEEIYPDYLKGAEVATYIAKLKAEAFIPTLQPNELLITGDTIVSLDGKALGKPKNKTEAVSMLQQLSGKSHEVVSAVCLATSEKKKVFYDVTKVYFKTLSSEEIEYYVNTYKPYDKAGAYGIQEWIGQIGVTKIEGSYFTVMGMPVHLLYKELLAISRA